MKTINAFISTPRDMDIHSLRATLAELDVRMIDRFSSPPGEAIPTGLRDLVKRADFCVVFLTPHDSVTAYELGLCAGLNRPMLVVTSPDDPFPPFIGAYTHIRARPSESFLLHLTLREFVRDLRAGKSRRKKRSQKPLGPSVTRQQATKALAHLSQCKNDITGAQLEHLIGDVLASVPAVSTSSAPIEGEHRADFALWLPELSGLLGSLILVEVKRGPLSKPQLAQAVDQLEKQLVSSEAALGLLLVSAWTEPSADSHVALDTRNPRILVLDVRHFLHSLTKHDLATTILRERNRFVHGV